jgi:hypothetical protein
MQRAIGISLSNIIVCTVLHPTDELRPMLDNCLARMLVGINKPGSIFCLPAGISQDPRHYFM